MEISLSRVPEWPALFLSLLFLLSGLYSTFPLVCLSIKHQHEGEELFPVSILLILQPSQTMMIEQNYSFVFFFFVVFFVVIINQRGLAGKGFGCVRYYTGWHGWKRVRHFCFMIMKSFRVKNTSIISMEVQLMPEGLFDDNQPGTKNFLIFFCDFLVGMCTWKRGF
jgi:hypothetical protein